MNSGRGRRMATAVRPSKMMELVNYQGRTNDKKEEENHSHVEYIMTNYEEDKTVDRVLTLVDVHNRLPKIQESHIQEEVSQDSDEEEEYGHSAQVSKQFEEPSHVLRKPAVPDKLAIERDRKLCPNDEGRKQKWKKKKRHRVTICTTNCKYELVRQIAMKLGMMDVGEDDSWNLYWTDVSISIEKVKEMKRFQKINHFPGMLEICRKDLLARNLNRMFKIFPNEYNFFPKTWCLPADYRDLVAYARTARNQTYICKPETGCQGRGIYVTKHITEIKPHDKIVCQIYISRPFLVDGFKFDLRLYVLITSCDPLRIYVYNEGLVRFATSRYREPTVANTSNVFMHLTNYAVNKHSRTYIVDDEAGSKRKISTLTNWLLKKDYDVQEMWSNIDDVIVKTIIAAHPILKHSYHACFPAHDFTYACFELLGFDILLDYRLKPYLLEVNHSPSFHTDAQIDCDVKENLLKDTFIILNLKQSDKRKVIEEDRRRVRERLLQGINHKDIEQRNNVAASSGSRPQDHWKTQVAWEESHMGNYRCIYPCLGYNRYEQFFHQNLGSLFQDTAASRAREEYARMQREELEMKAMTTSRKAGQKNKNFDKLQLESPLSKESKTDPAIKKRLMLPKRVAEKKLSLLNSFEPGQILESEERSRNIRMAERDFLLKRLGIAEQIVRLMKKNGSLRMDNEKKFNLYRKMYSSSYAVNEESSKLPSMFPNSNKPHFPRRINRSNFTTNPNPRLSITCYNAPIFKRPHIPHGTWLEGNGKEKDVRFTKTHMARSITNTYKLQEMVRRELQHDS